MKLAENATIQPIKDIETQLRSGPYSQMVENKKVIISLCEKESESGLFFNERLFLLYDNEYFGYVNYKKGQTKVPFKFLVDIPSRKKSIDLVHIKSVEPKQNKFIIKFQDTNSDTKKITDVTWIWKMLNAAMVTQWIARFEEAKQSRRKSLKRSEFRISRIEEVKVLQSSPNRLLEISEIKPKPSNLIVSTQQNVVVEPKPSVKLEEKVIEEKIIEKPQVMKTQEKKPEEITSAMNTPRVQYLATQSKIQQSNKMPQQKQQYVKKETPEFSVIKQSQKQDSIKETPIKILTKEQLNESSIRRVDSFGPDSHIKIEDQNNIAEDKQHQQPARFVDWNFELLSKDEIDVIQRFSQYSQQIVRRIIDEWCLPKAHRKYSASKNNRYEVENVTIKMEQITLTQTQINRSHKTTIYDLDSIKRLKNEFKNLDYLMKVTKNKNRIKVPLASLVQYKGVLCLVVANIKSVESPKEQQIRRHVKVLSDLCNLKEQIFLDRGCVNIAKGDAAYYKRLADEQNVNIQSNIFDILYIKDVDRLLPQDLLFKNKHPQNKCLRHELVEVSETKLEGRDILAYRDDSKEMKNAVANLQNANSKLLRGIEELIKQWESCQEIIIHPMQISRLFHRFGVNMRYLGIVHENSKLESTKKICIAEVAARTAKTILRDHVYNEILNFKSEQNLNKVSIQQFDDHLMKSLLDYLNLFVGNSRQSFELWNLMKRQAAFTFHIDVNRQEINHHYFLLALLQYSNLEINWDRLNIEYPLFAKTQYFQKALIKRFKSSTKTYNLDFTDTYKSLNEVLNYETVTSKDQITKILNLEQDQLPKHLLTSGLHYQVALNLANYISPIEYRIEGSKFRHLDLYNSTTVVPPTADSLNLLMMEIKWAMKLNEQDYVKLYFEKAMNIMKKWCGEFSPIYSEFYELLGVYEVSKSNYTEALALYKASVVNLLKSLEANHIKTADSYYQLGNVLLKLSKLEDAAVHYKKAKHILEVNQKDKEIGYALVCIRLGELYITQNNPNECIKTMSLCLRIVEEHHLELRENEEELIESYQLISRAYEINKNIKEQGKLVELCGNKLQIIQNEGNIDRILRIILSFELKNTKKGEKQIFEQFVVTHLKQLGDTSNIEEAYEYLKRYFRSKPFLAIFRQFIANVKQIIEYILENNTMTVYRGLRDKTRDEVQEFIALLQSLYIVLGEGFLLGAIDPN